MRLVNGNQMVRMRRQSKARNLLKEFGIWDEARGSKWEYTALNAYYSPFVITLASDANGSSDKARDVIRRLETAMDNATFDCPVLGKDYSIVEYFMHVKPLADLFSHVLSTSDASASLLKRLEVFEPLARRETSVGALARLYDHLLDNVLLEHGRTNGTLYYLELTATKTSNRGLVRQLILHCVQPETRQVTTETGTRRAFRCGFPRPNGIDWLEWSSPIIAVGDGARNIPVYVQSHVFERIHGRDARIFSGRDLEGWLHYFLYTSLKQPRIHPLRRDDGTYLVEYLLAGKRIGYLVVQKVNDLILVKTFLFITMDGTPEGENIRRRLRLRRADKEHLELDNLWTFLMTDLSRDPELIAIFEECGCGDVFDVGKKVPAKELEPGYASELRQFLGLD